MQIAWLTWATTHHQTAFSLSRREVWLFLIGRVAAGAFAAVATASCATGKPSLYSLTPLVNQTAIIDGSTCGCSFQALTAEAAALDVLQTDEVAGAIIGLAGRDVELTPVDDLMPLPDAGKQRVRTFSSDTGILVVLRTSVIDSCGADDEDCEIWREAGVASVAVAGRVRATYRIEGTCGC